MRAAPSKVGWVLSLITRPGFLLRVYAHWINIYMQKTPLTWSLEHGLVPLFKFCVTVSVLYITTALIHLQQSYHYNQGWKLHSSSHCFCLTLRSSVSKPRHFKQMFHRLFSPAADVIKGDCWKIYYEYIWSGVIHLSLMIVKKSFSTSHPTPLNSFMSFYPRLRLEGLSKHLERYS